MPPTDDPGNPFVDFRASGGPTPRTLDDQSGARLYKKAAGQEAKRCFWGMC